MGSVGKVGKVEGNVVSVVVVSVEDTMILGEVVSEEVHNGVNWRCCRVVFFRSSGI